MVSVNFNFELEIHQAFRLVTTQAMREDVKKTKVEDAGAGMTNVYMNALGFDQAIVQCYPNGEFDSVYIVISKDAEEHSIEINELPEFLQKEVFHDYCIELKRIV
jgi:hypothetical protein